MPGLVALRSGWSHYSLKIGSGIRATYISKSPARHPATSFFHTPSPSPSDPPSNASSTRSALSPPDLSCHWDLRLHHRPRRCHLPAPSPTSAAPSLHLRPCYCRRPSLPVVAIQAAVWCQPSQNDVIGLIWAATIHDSSTTTVQRPFQTHSESDYVPSEALDPQLSPEDIERISQILAIDPTSTQLCWSHYLVLVRFQVPLGIF